MYKSLKEEYIIFLDFDGVLNNASCEPEDNFLPEAITVLNKLHEEYQAKIVISSSWRTCYTMKQLMDLLKEHGCLCEVIDKTPEYIGKYEEKSTFLLSELEYEKSLKEEEGRNGEIISYVRIHNIKHYVILDDFYFVNKTLQPHCVLTDFFDEENGGLREHHLPQIREIFKL